MTEFISSQIYAGKIKMCNPDTMEASITVTVTKCGLSLEVMHDMDGTSTSLSILTKDIRRIEYSKVRTTFPFLCLYLNKISFSKIVKMSGMEQNADFHPDAEGRIFFILNVETFCLAKTFEVISFVSNNFSKTNIMGLGAEESRDCLAKGAYKQMPVFFLAEHAWYQEYDDLPYSKRSVYKGEKPYESRLFSSYIVIKYEYSKAHFVHMLSFVTNINILQKFMFNLFWHTPMIVNQCVEFLATHQCANPSCAKFSHEKCSACKVARYCDKTCQKLDSRYHLLECADLKKARKENLEIKLGKTLNNSGCMENRNARKNDPTGDFVTYDFFVSKMRAKSFQHYADHILGMEFLTNLLRAKNVKMSDSFIEDAKSFKNSIK